MNNIDISKFTNELLKLVKKSYKMNEIPVGALVIYNNKIIGKGFNNRQTTFNVCGHAEINAIKEAEKRIKDWRLNECILITTLKPCKMCNEVINSSRISKVYYIFDQNNIKYDNKFIKINYNDYNIEQIKVLFNNFFKELR